MTHKVTLGEIVDLLEKFKAQPVTLVVPEIPAGSFAKKLYSTYLSYLSKEKVIFDLKKNEDARGSFTELLKTESCGQFSVNISKPGITKGQHWHNTKWEFFIVVAGHGLIQERRVGSEDVLEFEVTGDKPQAIHMLPGYTHNIINLSETENLVTLMWANEPFDAQRPDTFLRRCDTALQGAASPEARADAGIGPLQCHVWQHSTILREEPMADYSNVSFKNNGKLKLPDYRRHAAGNHPAGRRHQQDAQIF